MKADRRKVEVVMARKCISIPDLQEATKMPKSTITKVLKGKNVLPATLGKVAAGLKVDVTDIIED
jgi:DNA-binding Xre family transcriptional regulator